MNLLNGIITLLLIVIAGVVLLPIIGLGVAIFFMLAAVFIWLLPILIILGSEKTTGIEKLLWIMAIIFLSWFAWILYFFLAPLKPRRDYWYN